MPNSKACRKPAERSYRQSRPGSRMLCFILIMCIFILFSGCGSPGETEGNSAESGAGENAEGSETMEGSAEEEGHWDSSLYELQAEKAAIFASLESKGSLLGIQFWQEEPIQLRTEWKIIEGTEDIVADIYLYREDGTGELLAENFSQEEVFGRFFLAQDGSLYSVRDTAVTKWNAEGEKLFSSKTDCLIKEICELEDGRIIVLQYDSKGLNSTTRIAEMNSETGNVSNLNNILLETLNNYHIGTGKEGLYLMAEGAGIWKVDPESGSKTAVLDFTNATYNIDNISSEIMQAFRVLENGETEILWRKSEEGLKETLKMVKSDRIQVVISGYNFFALKEDIAAFNKDNEKYRVVMDTPQEGAEEEFSRNLSIQIATGKGPDILFGEVLDDYIQGMIEKGAFEDLKPYMDESGIREEDYFPAAFICRRDGDKVYGINTEMQTFGWLMDADILGGQGEPDIETLADALLAWPEKSMYAIYYWDSRDILRSFLEGSESIWGMVDWEQGKCDFGGELFGKLLEAAKRYVYDEDQDYPVIAEEVTFANLYYFGSTVQQEKKGRVIAGPLFDDGYHAKIYTDYHILSVNANSAQKEGAWAFIRYLLGQEVQTRLAQDGDVPVLRKAMDVYLEKVLELVADGETFDAETFHLRKGKYVSTGVTSISEEDVSGQWIEEYIEALEEARPLPLRTIPILDIICEEAEDYFQNRKSIDEVADVVQNRVQLYLDEHN